MRELQARVAEKEANSRLELAAIDFDAAGLERRLSYELRPNKLFLFETLSLHRRGDVLEFASRRGSVVLRSSSVCVPRGRLAPTLARQPAVRAYALLSFSSFSDRLVPRTSSRAPSDSALLGHRRCPGARWRSCGGCCARSPAASAPRLVAARVAGRGAPPLA